MPYSVRMGGRLPPRVARGVCCSGTSGRRPQANATVRNSFHSSSCMSPSVGEQLMFSLEVENGENVSAYQATVSFDTSALRYVKSTAGDYLPEGAFFVPPAIDGHRLTVGAVSLGGTSHGNGTLAALSFEVLAVKNSTVTLSEVSLVDPDAKQSFPRIEDARVERPSRVVGDANGDGVIGILDLPQVAASGITETGTDWMSDVNQDGVVDTADLFQAVTDLEIAKKEPAAYLAAQAILTSRDVSEWLGQPRKSNLAEADLKRSIRAVRHQLAVSVPGETALLPNYPNPFDQGDVDTVSFGGQGGGLYHDLRREGASGAAFSHGESDPRVLCRSVEGGVLGRTGR